jgi:ribosomal protein S18 acetylase RimI-like enzyme
MTKKIRIKKTRESNNAYLIAKSLPDYFDKNGLRNIKRDVKNHILYGAFLKNKMIGFVTYKEINSEVIEMTWTGVKKEFHSRGIGKKMILHSLGKLKDKYKICKVKTLAETCSDVGYKKTRKFYKKLGFIPFEIIDPYPGWTRGNPCQIYIKILR